ncbi:hypothetical protein K438DRAFT_2125835 [Mycena galopus ATCC 62051]|nr:hypothetical protein K438DRAFT_2125835 [Mycena galopus ATCC 62051]
MSSDLDFPVELAGALAPSTRVTHAKAHPIVLDSDSDATIPHASKNKNSKGKGKGKRAPAVLQRPTQGQITVPMARTLMASVEKFVFEQEAKKLSTIRSEVANAKKEEARLVKQLRDEQERRKTVEAKRIADVTALALEIEIESNKAQEVTLEVELARMKSQNKTRQPIGFAQFSSTGFVNFAQNT